MNTGMSALVAGVVAAVVCSGAAHGQSLLEDPPEQTATTSATPLVATPGGTVAEQLQSVSLFAVVPPRPRTFAKHDPIEVIINESSVSKMNQSLETDKQYNLTAELSKFPSLKALLDLNLSNGGGDNLPVGVGVKNNHKYKGEGDFERKDNLTARLSALVIDVKPNGTLVLEARESRTEGEESTVLVLSGVCRAEDITRQNTIQSSQLANLTIRIDREGQIKKAGEKGFIPRIFEAIFNF